MHTAYEDRKVGSDALARLDTQIDAILAQGYEKASEIIHQHRKALDKIVDALIEKETLEGTEVVDLIL